MAAPSLVNTIKLRSLVDQLDNVEFSQFLDKLVNLCGRNIILTPLFHQLTASQTTFTEIEPDRIENIVDIARNIIRSRKNKPQKRISIPTFNSLSGNLIGELASYLVHTDYICFSKVNRAAMIHCNTPNTLRCLDLVYDKSLDSLSQNESFDLQRYPSINRLCFYLTQFDKFRLPEKSVANNLQHLFLNCDGADVDNAQAFMDQNSINFNNIKSLTLEDVNSGDSTFWREILLKFSMVQHLFLLDVSSENFVSEEDIQTLFVNLKVLAMDSSVILLSANIANTFLRVYANKLEYLYLNHDNDDVTIESNISFSKLQQLQVECVCDDVLNNILKTANQLRKVSVVPCCQRCDKDMIIMIEKIISSQPLLEYIDIEDKLFFDCDAVFAGIEYGLYNTKKVNRKRFKISVKFASDLKKHSGSHLILRVARIINILSQLSNVNEFMFIVRFTTTKKKVKEIMKAVDDFRECQKSTIVVKTYCEFCDDPFHSIVITNKDCKINGFSEPWPYFVGY